MYFTDKPSHGVMGITFKKKEEDMLIETMLFGAIQIAYAHDMRPLGICLFDKWYWSVYGKGTLTKNKTK